MGWRIASVALGGSIGAIVRYAIGQWAGGVDDGVFPWGTVLANMLGSLLLGLVFGLTERGAFSERVRLFLAVGLLGGFTTFSLFSYENLELLRTDRFVALAANALGQLVIGIGATSLGFLIARPPRREPINR